MKKLIFCISFVLSMNLVAMEEKKALPKIERIYQYDLTRRQPQSDIETPVEKTKLTKEMVEELIEAGLPVELVQKFVTINKTDSQDN